MTWIFLVLLALVAWTLCGLLAVKIMDTFDKKRDDTLIDIDKRPGALVVFTIAWPFCLLVYAVICGIDRPRRPGFGVRGFYHWVLNR